MRHPGHITGIVVHQTAVKFGVGKWALRAAGGSRRLARRRRVAKKVPCHGAALMDGQVILTRPFRSYVWHGNGFNAYTLGIEIEGNYPGLMTDASTAWKGKPHELTECTIQAAKRLLTWMVMEAAKEQIFIKHIYAHRQSSGTRRADPGEEIWKRVVLEHAVRELGLEPRTELALVSKGSGGGKPIPTAWDPENGVGGY